MYDTGFCIVEVIGAAIMKPRKWTPIFHAECAGVQLDCLRAVCRGKAEPNIQTHIRRLVVRWLISKVWLSPRT